MKQDLICEYCKKHLARCHGYQVNLTLVQHFRAEHEAEYKEMAEARKSLRNLQEKYKFKGDIRFVR